MKEKAYLWRATGYCREAGGQNGGKSAGLRVQSNFHKNTVASPLWLHSRPIMIETDYLSRYRLE